MELDFNKINVAQPMDLTAMYQSENMRLQNENMILLSQLNSTNKLLTKMYEEHPEAFSKNLLMEVNKNGNDDNQND